jgi:hypothetical protein
MPENSSPDSNVAGTPPLAPCIAVVGPANAGKTTLLHQLDEKLKPRLDSFLVLKGNPDGSGRYLYHSPELRNEPEFKKSAKGQWGDATVDRVCEWVIHGRSNLSLALLDFGGRHDDQTAAGNARMLRVCSHYLVVSRDQDPDGAAFWDVVCRGCGLIRLGWMRSLPLGGATPTVLDSGPAIHATFQVNVLPGNRVNDVVLAPLLDLLAGMAVPPDHTPYVNLHLPTDWRTEQIDGVAGQASKIAELASRTGVVVLGGAAPVWAYLAGLRCALEARGDARVFFFDPRQPERLVEIPASLGVSSGAAGAFPLEALSVTWAQDGALSFLQLKIITPDKFLPPVAAQNLAGAPAPLSAPTTAVALSGPGCPLWLFGAYARHLRTAGAGSLASWDGRMQSCVRIW